MARLTFSWSDNNGKLAQHGVHVSESSTATEALATANQLRGPFVALSNAALTEAEYVTDIPIAPKALTGSTEINARIVLFFNGGSFSLPSGAVKDVDLNVPPYNGTRMLRADTPQDLLDKLDELGSLVVNLEGVPLGLFVMAVLGEVT